jgi:hypothetical protein
VVINASCLQGSYSVVRVLVSNSLAGALIVEARRKLSLRIGQEISRNHILLRSISAFSSYMLTGSCLVSCTN